MPAGTLQQRRNPPIPIAAILAGQNDDGLRESIFVFSLCRLIALRAAWLIHPLARSPLAHPMLAGMAYRTAPSFRT
jgi:hypothetical protein